MEIHLGTSYERDIDLLIMEECISSSDFLRIIMDAAGIIGDFSIVQAFHSKRDEELGESDIVFVLSDGNTRHALHIEDKTKAMAMQDQCERYSSRAGKEVLHGEYDSYSVLITAPIKYLDSNSEAAKYDHRISYEEIRNYFSIKTDARSIFKLAVLNRAIDECKSGYQWVENQKVKAFCKSMNEYSKVHYPNLTEGSSAWWPHWRTCVPKTVMVFKANYGCCDLTFRRTSVQSLHNRVSKLMSSRMTIVKTGKSASIRIRVSRIDMSSDFDSNIAFINEALDALTELDNLAKTILEAERTGL